MCHNSFKEKCFSAENKVILANGLLKAIQLAREGEDYDADCIAGVIHAIKEMDLINDKFDLKKQPDIIYEAGRNTWKGKRNDSQNFKQMFKDSFILNSREWFIERSRKNIDYLDASEYL